MIDQPRRVALIVDNPKRDLTGLCLLAVELAQRDIEAWIVPMYEQDLFINSLCPQAVVANYCRANNAKKIRQYAQMGSSVCVLDTEGGVLRDVYKELVVSIEDSGAGDQISLYCTWGDRQHAGITTFFKSIDHNAAVISTGSPRYDLFHRNYQKLLPNPTAKNNYVLLIASFPLCNPRFVSPEQEAQNMCDALDYTLEEIQAMQQAAAARMTTYLSLLADLVKEHPDTDFVLRMHPFEDPKPYQQQFSGISNLTINEEGEIFPIIRDAQLVVQINSSVGIEAAMCGKPVIQPQWLQDPVDEVEQATASSFLAESPEHFHAMFTALHAANDLDHHLAQRQTEIQQHVDELVRGFFTALDGCSSQRAAEAIAQTAQQNTSQRVTPMANPTVQHVKRLLRLAAKTLIKPFSAHKRRAKAISVGQVKNTLHTLGVDGQHIVTKQFGFGGGLIGSRAIGVKPLQSRKING